LGSFIEKECSLDQAKLTIYSQEKNLKKILSVVNEILDQAIYPKSEIEIFKNIKLQKLQINKEKNAWIANQEFKKKLYKNDHPYGKSINEDAINSFSSSDLIDFYNSFYNPENCYLIVSGKVNEQTLNVINESLGQKNWNKNSSPIKNTIAKNIPIVSEKGSFKFDNSNKAQASIKYGRVLFNRTHPDFYGMQVLSTLLGGYFGSRLMKNIREEKGYTYGIGSSVVSNKDSGYFVISTEVKNEVKELTIQEIEKEIVTLQNVLVNTEELDLVKNYMLGSFLRMFDGVFSKSERLNTLIINDIDESHYLNYIEKIKNISAIELQNLANKYLNKHDITEIIVC
jgi:predicted Zn-dependent peptidase